MIVRGEKKYQVVQNKTAWSILENEKVIFSGFLKESDANRYLLGYLDDLYFQAQGLARF